MTRLLEEAIEELRDLPEEEQDAAADVVFTYVSSEERQYGLHPHQVDEIRRVRRDLNSGKTRLATDQEVAERKAKSGL